METLRRHLRIERWLVFGGSWGSTLALAYAEAHPERCLGLILRGIFLCRKSEIDWFLYGVQQIFSRSLARIRSSYVPEPSAAICSPPIMRLTDPDPKMHMPAARKWSVYEGSCSTLLPSAETGRAFRQRRGRARVWRASKRITSSTISSCRTTRCSTTCNKIRKFPAVIVQGRYDAVCPIVTADDLHRGLAGSRIHHRAGRRPFGVRAGHPRRTRRRHRTA